MDNLDFYLFQEIVNCGMLSSSEFPEQLFMIKMSIPGDFEPPFR